VLKALKKNPIFRFLASLKLAVILLVSLAAILAVATFYESVYDTKTAQYLVYRSPLFALFLGVLGINLTASALIRYPWKKAQAGFVVTHVGIIIILIGSLVNMFSGIDGTMALEEGETSSRVTLDQPVLYFGRDLNTISEIPAEYRWNRPEPGKTSHRYKVEEGLVAVIDDYYHHAEAETVYLPDQEGLPALQLRLHNANVDQSIWLTPTEGKIPMGAAQVEFYRLPDAAAVEAFQKPAESMGRGTLQVLINNQPLVVDLDRAGDTAYPLDFEGASLKLLSYLPHAVVEDGKLVSRSQDPVNPAVEVELSNAAGSQKWLLFSALPELNTRVHSEGEPLEVRLLYSRPEQPQEHTLEVGLTPEGKLLYRLDGKKSGELLDGQPIETGWMNLKAEKVTFLEKGRRDKLLREVFPKKGNEDKAPGPAIRLTLEGSGQSEPIWLQRGDIRRMPDADGKEVIIGYGYKTVPLDFSITLKEFRIGYDPGTQTPASYESDVTIGDKDYTIAMNEPYEKDGVKVFQASFGETPAGQSISVFAVAHDPGIGLKYFGSIMLVIGIIMQFYFKPRKTRGPVNEEESAQEAPLA
jgi:hypothetical protein